MLFGSIFFSPLPVYKYDGVSLMWTGSDLVSWGEFLVTLCEYQRKIFQEMVNWINYRLSRLQMDIPVTQKWRRVLSIRSAARERIRLGSESHFLRVEIETCSEHILTNIHTPRLRLRILLYRRPIFNLNVPLLIEILRYFLR